MKKRILTLLTFISVVSFAAEQGAAEAADSGGATAKSDSDLIAHVLATVTKLLEGQEERLRILEDENRRVQEKLAGGVHNWGGAAAAAAGAGAHDSESNKFENLLLALKIAKMLEFRDGGHRHLNMILPRRDSFGKGADMRSTALLDLLKDALGSFLRRSGWDFSRLEE